MLWVARAIQGLGGAVMVPVSLAIIAATFPDKERGLAIGIWGGVVGLATAIGPLIGGVLVEKVSWQAIFFVNLPVGGIGIALTTWAVRESRDDRAPRAFDLFGLVTITVSMFCLVLALIQGNDADKGWTSPYILSLLAVAVLTLFVFVLGELRMRNPMADPRLFKNAGFAGACIAAFAISAGLYSLFFYLALYFQNFLGYGPLDAGLRFLPLSVPALVVSPIAGWLTGRMGARPFLAGGLALAALAVALMTRISPTDRPSDWVVLLPAFIVAGACSAAVNSSTSVVVLGSVDRARAGMASGVSGLCRQLGIAFGIAFLGALLTSHYNGAVHDRVMAMRTPAPIAGALTSTVRQTIIHDLRTAGPIAGSLGLHGDQTHPNPHAHSPLAPAISQVARAAFADALTFVFKIAALLLAGGAVASLVLVRQPTSQPRIQRSSVGAEDGELAAAS
jgi:EmrB/QacA subfamily drug resistance transporter